MKTAILDLASMFHRLWHIDKENVTHKIVSFLRTLQVDKIIVAIDSPPYKRKESYPEYKANRDTPEPDLVGCLKATIKAVNEQYVIAKSEGWEADDVIATIINEMMDKGTYNAEDVIVFGQDKDLLQITNLTDPLDGSITNPVDKFGVTQDQVVDYLSLIGDKSDNIKHPEGIGPTTASGLLSAFGSIDGIYKAIKATPEKFTKPAVFKALNESESIVREAMSLIALNCAVTVEYIQPQPSKANVMDEEKPAQKTEIAKTENAIVLQPEPLEYKRSLEPIGMTECWKMSNLFDRSGMYPKFKGPEQIMMVIMRGRELGFGATSSLELIEMIQGKPAMRAAGMLGKVLSHRDVCEYFICDEMTETKCTWTTKRTGYPKPVSRTFTIEDAIRMEYIIPDGVIVKDKYGNKKESKDNWTKQPAVMIQWRACTQLIRQVYPDLINGLYSKEELQDNE